MPSYNARVEVIVRLLVDVPAQGENVDEAILNAMTPFAEAQLETAKLRRLITLESLLMAEISEAEIDTLSVLVDDRWHIVNIYSGEVSGPDSRLSPSSPWQEIAEKELVDQLLFGQEEAPAK